MSTERGHASCDHRILVVDDYPHAAESLARWLRGLGHDAKAATDGTQALEMAEQYQPDVIFLDIAMPKLDGYEVATRIRNQPWGKKIFLVALTGLSGEEDRQQSRKVGFNKHIAKPVAREKISCILDSYLRQDVARSGN